MPQGIDIDLVSPEQADALPASLPVEPLGVESARLVKGLIRYLVDNSDYDVGQVLEHGGHSASTALFSCGAPTGFDSEEPRWRR